MKTKQRTHLRRDDTVQVMTGADRGKSGKITQIFPKEGMAVVDGINLRSKAVRPKRQGQKGEIIQYNAPMRVDNLMLVCPSCHKATRVRYSILPDAKQRICTKCKQIISK